MTVKRSPWGETPRRIYTTLRRHPGLTVTEIHRKLPDLSHAAISSAIQKMLKRGELLQVEARPPEGKSKGRNATHAYKVKYKGIKARTKQSDPKPEYVAKLKVVDTQPDDEALVIHHLTDIYRALTLMTDQQDALIAILKDTLLQLDAAEQELERERQRRNWWDKVKEWFV